MKLITPAVFPKASNPSPSSKILAQLDLKGHTVTIDAMGAQVPIAQQIIDANAHYILAIKGNQGRSHKEVMDHFDIALRHLDLKATGWSHHQ